MLYLEIAIVVVLICVNGLLAMSELAIVSSRPARLKAMIDRDVKGAASALQLGADPGKFLSSVQIGITLVGVLSGAFSGATLGLRLSMFLETLGVSTRIADPAGVGVVVALIT
jgi:putative hemolysin